MGKTQKNAHREKDKSEPYFWKYKIYIYTYSVPL